MCWSKISAEFLCQADLWSDVTNPTHTWSTITEYLKLCTKWSLTTWTIYKRLSCLIVSASAGATPIDHSQASYLCSVWWILQQEPPSRMPGTDRLLTKDANQHTEHTRSWSGEYLWDYPKFPHWRASVAESNELLRSHLRVQSVSLFQVGSLYNLCSWLDGEFLDQSYGILWLLFTQTRPRCTAISQL